MQQPEQVRRIVTPGGTGRLVLGELSPYFHDAKALLSKKDAKGRQDVFVNVPYDSGHGNVVDAILFATLQCGFLPRLAILGINSSAARLERITELLLKCPLSIHDLTVRRSQHGNARLNMAFELGVAIGCARAMRRQKPVLILDRRPYEVSARSQISTDSKSAPTMESPHLR